MWETDLPPAECFLPDSRGLQALVNEIYCTEEVALDTETTGLSLWKAVPLFWSLAWRSPSGALRRVFMPASTLIHFRDCFADPEKRWIFANAKFDTHMLANVGINIAGHLIDTQVMHALLYEEERHGLKQMHQALFGWVWKDFEKSFGKINKKVDGAVGDLLLQHWETNRDNLIEYAANDAYGTFRIYEKLREELVAAGTWSAFPEEYPTLWELFDKTEVPFTKVLWHCERNGQLIDVEFLKTLEVPIEQKIKELEKQMVALRGKMFNPQSGPQRKEWLVNERGLQPFKKTKGGKTGVRQDSIDKSFYEKYEDDEAVQLLSEHAKLSKMLGTYVQKLPANLDPFNRAHPRFNQDIARCMPAGELVLTNHGYLPVEQVRIGDLVLAHTGRPRAVIETSTHTPRPIYKVTLSNGLTLRTTGNHPYRIGEDWVNAEHLQVGDKVTVHSEPEQWRAIRTWEPYEVSTWGRVRHGVTGRIRQLNTKDSYGHLKVSLARNGAQQRGPDRKDFGVHRLVLSAFTESSLEEVRHLNGIPWDNTLRNLQYGTSKENTEDARRHGTLGTLRQLTDTEVAQIRATEIAGQPPSSTSKLSFGAAEIIRRRFRQGESRAQLAQEFDVSYPAIDNIVKGRTWTRAPSATARTTEELAAQYGVSPGYIREICRGIKRAPHDDVEGALATFYEASVVSVCIEEPETIYGLTVDEDHSHVTAGIVTHNTGRLSSSGDYNAQNIPNTEKDKFRVRHAFIAGPGKKLIVGDYEQLEMRVLSIFADEPDMIDVFNRGWDIHMGNAALVFAPSFKRKYDIELTYEKIEYAKKVDKKIKNKELPPDAMTEELRLCLSARQAAKTIGFG